MMISQRGSACLEASLILPIVLGILLLGAAVTVALQEDRRAEDTVDSLVRSLEGEGEKMNEYSAREIVDLLSSRLSTTLDASYSPSRYVASVGFVTLDGDGSGYRMVDRYQKKSGTFTPSNYSSDDTNEAIAHLSQESASGEERRTLFLIRVSYDTSSSFSQTILEQLGLPKSTNAIRVFEMRNGSL